LKTIPTRRLFDRVSNATPRRCCFHRIANPIAIAVAVLPAVLLMIIPARAQTTAAVPSELAQTTPAKPPATPAVADNVFVDSGDTRLFVEIKGSKKSAPVLLFLHEGPGNPVGVLAFEAYPGGELEKNFIVAYLRQRGVLQSPEVPVASQTLANHIRDVDNVVDYLRKRFGKDRVSLIGHSWGGMLGYLYLAQHSEKIDKFVSIAAPFNTVASQFASYEMTLQWARDTNNQAAVDGLVRLGSPPYRTSQEALTKTLWSADAFGGITKGLDMKKAMEAGGFAEYDPAWGDKQLEINEAMYAEIQKINVESEVARITTPLLLIAARNDAEVPYFSLKNGFDKWGGRKEFLVFDRSNHILFIDETERFVTEVTRFLGK